MAHPMKKYLALLFVLTSLTVATNAQSARDYMDGQISRDVASAMERAKKTDKPVFIMTYNADNKEMSSQTESENEFAFRGFFGIQETRKLLSENFVQIFAPWSAKGIEPYLDKTDKTGEPVAIFLDQNGTIISRFPCRMNPKDGLKRVQEVVNTLKAKPASPIKPVDPTKLVDPAKIAPPVNPLKK